MKKMLKEIVLSVEDIIKFIRPLGLITFVKKFRYDVKLLNKKNNIIIVGNGPSATQFFDEVSKHRDNFDLCTVNFAILTKSFFDVRPEYLVLADPLFFTHLEDERVKNVLATITKVNWKLTILIPYSKDKSFRKVVERNINVQLMFFSGICWDAKSIIGRWLRMRLYCLGLLSPRIQNVIVACIFCSIHLGYREIKLYGVEHSWIKDIVVNEKNEVCLVDRHYYGTEKKPWKKDEFNTFKMDEILNTLAYTFKSYWELNELAKAKNVRIVNMTKESFIDAFEREK